MTAQHTPGPWHVETRDEGDYVYAGDFRICYPLGCEGNASLIAAAPELLAALSDLLKAASVKGINPIMYENCKTKARAAIAKAQS